MYVMSQSAEQWDLLPQHHRPDDDLFQAPQVPVKICVEVTQVDDGVDNQLAWAMERDFAASFSAVERVRGIFWIKPQVVQGAA